MKIGIITMFKVQNFGSHLQAFALQKKIKDLGYDVEIINYDYPNEFHNKKLISKKKVFNCVIRKTLFAFYYGFIFFVRRKQKKAFKVFEANQLILSRVYKNQEDLRKDSLSYDMLLTGSDQVWNPKYAFGDTIFMCNFGSEIMKRCSYASSIAVSQLPIELEHVYKECLSKYSYISVRENSSKEILEKVLNKKISVVCDPVFLLNKNEWKEISLKSKIRFPDRYILVFILTYSFDPYPEIVNIVKSIKARMNLPIIFYNASVKKIFQLCPNKNIFSCSVEDFLTLIKNASFIITTSFHVTAFSLIFNKQFVCIVKDETEDSRIIDLLKVFDVENYFTINNFDEEKIQSLNYSEINKKIVKYKNESEKFLNKILE